VGAKKKPKGTPRHPWDKVRNAYISDERHTWETISKDFNIPIKTVASAAHREHWTLLRRNFRGKVLEKTPEEAAKLRAIEIVREEAEEREDAALLRSKGRKAMESKPIQNPLHAIRALEVSAALSREALGMEKGPDVAVNITQQSLTLNAGNLEQAKEDFLRRLARVVAVEGTKGVAR
jgi:hypothetical protein